MSKATSTLRPSGALPMACRPGLRGGVPPGRVRELGNDPAGRRPGSGPRPCRRRLVAALTTGRSVPPPRTGRIGCWRWPAAPTRAPGATASATRRRGGRGGPGRAGPGGAGGGAAAPLLLALGERLPATGGDACVVRRVRREHPDDFWVNFALGPVLREEAKTGRGAPPATARPCKSGCEAAVLNNLGSRAVRRCTAGPGTESGPRRSTSIRRSWTRTAGRPRAQQPRRCPEGQG